MTSKHHIAVVGGGAVGTVIAAAAEQAGHATTLCVRTNHGQPTLQSNGVTRRLEVEVIDDPAKARPADWVLLATKAYDVGAVGGWMGGLLTPDSVLVICQNGLEHRARVGEIATTLVLPAVVSIMAERTGPGIVVHRGGNMLTVEASAIGEGLVEVFRDSPLSIALSDDMARSSWLKYLGNLAAAPLTTLTMQRMGVLRSPELQWLIEAILIEAVAVARTDGVDIRDADVAGAMAALSALDPDIPTSMQVDRARGNRIEVEALTGELVRKAARHGLPVPMNSCLLSLLRCLPTNGVS